MNRKTMLIVGGGVALVLIFLYMRSRSSGGAAGVTDTLGTPSDQQASDYASLAGQAQQGAAQEATDIAGLQGDITALSGQEAADIAAINGQIAGIDTSGIVGPEGPQGPPGVDAVAMATGHITKHHGKPGHRHGKTGQTKRNAASHHSSAHHPAGTAGHAIAPRNHGSHRPGQAKPGQHPATHSSPSHPRSPGQRQVRNAPPRTTVRNAPPAPYQHPAPPPARHPRRRRHR